MKFNGISLKQKMLGNRILPLLIAIIGSTECKTNLNSQCRKSRNASEICKVFRNLDIIPDVLDTAPKEFLKVVYYPGPVMVDKGNELTPTQMKYKPKVEWTADADAYYTLVMTGVDAPSRQKPDWREWMHWWLVNIPGNDTERAEVLCPYITPAPPKDAGSLSRFVVLVFRQPGEIMFAEKAMSGSSVEGHSNFDTRKFAKNYALGDPIAGNVLQTRWDEYVPTVFQQLHLEL